jgi:hypothetical protein
MKALHGVKSDASTESTAHDQLGDLLAAGAQEIADPR